MQLIRSSRALKPVPKPPKCRQSICRISLYLACCSMKSLATGAYRMPSNVHSPPSHPFTLHTLLWNDKKSICYDPQRAREWQPSGLEAAFWSSVFTNLILLHYSHHFLANIVSFFLSLLLCQLPADNWTFSCLFSVQKALLFVLSTQSTANTLRTYWEAMHFELPSTLCMLMQPLSA